MWWRSSSQQGGLNIEHWRSRVSLKAFMWRTWRDIGRQAKIDQFAKLDCRVIWRRAKRSVRHCQKQSQRHC